ncbi:VOC family protein [Saccharopolyspora pogona]|uniref:VOC family protein n=1 Tax=Saccharopolyspora pogona TaxID=333966 RepID=UPI001CC24C47|nr:VOC family protein [Saccharopolyspora pogona]
MSDSEYDAAVERVRAHGVQVNEVEFSPGNARSAYVADPDHNIVEFWTWDVRQGNPGAPSAISEGVFGL